jgi:hypothetical protein
MAVADVATVSTNATAINLIIVSSPFLNWRLISLGAGIRRQKRFRAMPGWNTGTEGHIFG